LFERAEDGCGAGAIYGVLLEDLVDLLFFIAGALDDLALFAEALGDVVFGVSASGEVASEAHRDGACGDLGEAGEDDDAGGGYGSRKTGGEGEGDGEAVGETDDDIADGLAGFKVAFDVGTVMVVRVVGRVTLGRILHGGSVVQRGRFGDVGHGGCEFLRRLRVFRGEGTSV
jgi:hypothetical protein